MNKNNKNDLNEVTYMDENGDPINPSNINPGNCDFTDEDGNPVDQFGNPLDEMNETEFLNHAFILLQQHRYQEMFTYICECLNVTENEILKTELNKLRAVALGGLDRHQEARELLLELLEQKSTDGFVLANYIASCLACGDGNSAISAIAIYYPDLDGSSKGAVLENVVEALNMNALHVDQLSKEIVPDLTCHLNSKSET